MFSSLLLLGSLNAIVVDTPDGAVSGVVSVIVQKSIGPHRSHSKTSSSWSLLHFSRHFRFFRCLSPPCWATVHAEPCHSLPFGVLPSLYTTSLLHPVPDPDYPMPPSSVLVPCVTPVIPSLRSRNITLRPGMSWFSGNLQIRGFLNLS